MVLSHLSTLVFLLTSLTMTLVYLRDLKGLMRAITFVVVKVETDPRRKLKVDLEFLKYLPPKNFLFPFEQNLLIAANQPDRYGHNKCLFDQNYFNFLSITKLCSSCTA